jgi:hypothetical protein
VVRRFGAAYIILVGDHGADVLAAEGNLVGLQYPQFLVLIGGEPGGVVVGEHGDHAVEGSAAAVSIAVTQPRAMLACTGSVTDLAVGRSGCERQVGQVHRGDELAVAQQRVAVGFIPRAAGTARRVGWRARCRAVDLDHGVKRGQRQRDVRGVGRHTVFGGTEDGVVAVVPIDR